MKAACSAVLLILAVAATPAHADIAVKFFGTATGGDLSPEIAQAVADSGVAVKDFGCFELPIYDVQTGHQQGVGVDCLNVFDAAGVEATLVQLRIAVVFRRTNLLGRRPHSPETMAP